MRHRRRTLPAAARRAAARSLASRALNLRALRRARRVAAYLANDGELDPAELIRRLRRAGKRVYVPVLRGTGLWFLPYGGGAPMPRNRFGIPEPAATARLRCPPRRLDVALVPLVAFDARGQRLGMGGGFYDRTFAYLHGRGAWSRPRLVGLAYAWQQVPALPQAPWDVPLAAVVTDRGTRRWPTTRRAGTSGRP